jgi:hypothetical protein
VVLTGAGQFLKPLEYNNLQVMGYSAESDQHNQRNLPKHSGIKSTTEQTLTNRNNTNEMLPENNTGKDDETVERTHNTKMAKQREEPGDQKRTSTATLDNIATEKLDPTIGSTRKKTTRSELDSKH